MKNLTLASAFFVAATQVASVASAHDSPIGNPVLHELQHPAGAITLFLAAIAVSGLLVRHVAKAAKARVKKD